MKQFGYDQLPPEPSSPGDALRCTITTTALTSTIDYEAISYCWGSNETVDSISCDNQASIPINQSLSLALRYFRHPRQTRCLWADAICINQSNVEEKSIQVGLIKDVSQRAWRVLVWLGEDGGGDSIEPLINLARKIKGSDLENLQKDRVACQNAVGFGKVHIYALVALLGKPWFAVAHRAILFCGYKSIDWADLCLILELESGVNLIGVNNQVVMDIVSGIDLECKAIGRGTPTTLLQVLLRHRMSLATDHRDKIFALLGLCTQETLQPDYHLPVGEVYKRFTKSYICQHHSLDIVTAPSDPAAHQPSRKPSWVPDWGAIDVAFPLALRTQLLPEVDYQATKGSKWTPAFSGDGDILRINVQYLDTVDVLGVVRQPFRPDKPDMKALFSQLRNDLITCTSWYKIGLADAKGLDDIYHMTGETLFNTCWQILVAGCSPTEYEELRTQSLRVWKLFKAFPFVTKLQRLPQWAFQLIYQLSKIPGRRIFAQRLLNEALANDLQFRIRRSTSHRRLMRTSQWYLGLAPAVTQVGDHVVLIEGLRTPAILRPANKGWEFIGDCYVHGCMNGEAFRPDLCNEMFLV
ncbi:heterokaryon incompatibility protein-domain-containing protein [Nemania sp. FL0031]|nr:heterokaryon incompatibility protein-domain-containing protein [Nemania sp. FL0031]